MYGFLDFSALYSCETVCSVDGSVRGSGINTTILPNRNRRNNQEDKRKEENKECRKNSDNDCNPTITPFFTLAG